MELGTKVVGERTSVGVFVIQLDGEFDLSERDRLRDAFAIAQSSPIVVISLQKATYIDSTVLKCLVELRTTTQKRGASLVLVGMRPEVLRIFEVTGLDQLFDIRTSLGEVSDVDITQIRRLTIEARQLP